MKTMLTLLFTSCLISGSVLAQPTVTRNEYYEIGQVITMINADSSGLSADTAGAGISWDYSRLGGIGSNTTSVMSDTLAPFDAIANITILSPGYIKYVQETSSDSYLMAVYDSSSGTTYNYDTYRESHRPITYGTVVSGTYTMNTTGSTTASHGVGTVTETGDAYGTILLPTGTFTNVLRIKEVQNEVDTVEDGTSTYNTPINTVSYLWFDTIHSAPLLRIDSVTNISGLTRDIMYLSAADLAVSSVMAGEPLSYTAWIEDNSLHLRDNFSANKTYEVDVYDMIGSKLYTAQFTGYGQTQQFDMNRDISPGIYIVSVTATDDPSSRVVQKVVKH